VIQWYLDGNESLMDADFHATGYYAAMNEKKTLAREAIWKVFHLKFNYPETRKKWMLDEAEGMTPVALQAFIANMKPDASWTRTQREKLIKQKNR